MSVRRQNLKNHILKRSRTVVCDILAQFDNILDCTSVNVTNTDERGCTFLYQYYIGVKQYENMKEEYLIDIDSF